MDAPDYAGVRLFGIVCVGGCIQMPNDVYAGLQLTIAIPTCPANRTSAEERDSGRLADVARYVVGEWLGTESNRRHADFQEVFSYATIMLEQPKWDRNSL